MVSCVCACVRPHCYTQAFSMLVVQEEPNEKSWKAGQQLTKRNGKAPFWLGKMEKVCFCLQGDHSPATGLMDWRFQPSLNLYWLCGGFCVGHSLHNLTGLPSWSENTQFSFLSSLNYLMGVGRENIA